MFAAIFSLLFRKSKLAVHQPHISGEAEGLSGVLALWHLSRVKPATPTDHIAPLARPPDITP